LIDIPKCRAVLYYYANETDSFISLFTKGISRPKEKKELTDKQFEDLLVQTFRKVNENVVQVNIFPNGQTYIGRVYLKNEDEGQQFLKKYKDFLEIL
jgi:hypothetical protein